MSALTIPGTETAEGYRLLFEKSPLPMWVFDAETLSFLAVNETAIIRYGYSRDEFLSMTIRDIRPVEDQADLVRMATGLSGSNLIHPRTWRHVRKDGVVMLVEVTSNEMVWNGRKARLVLAQDVTRQREAELQALDWQHKYEAATQASGQVLYEWTPAEDRIAYGQNVKNLLGYSEAELAGGLVRFLEIVHPEDRERVRRDIERLASLLEPFSVEFRMRKQNGELIYVESKGEPTLLSGVPPRVIGFLTDVTPRRMLEAQFVEAQKMEAVGQMAGGMAHDFNNVIGIILGYAQLLQDKLHEDQALAQFPQRIVKAAGRAADLTRQLMAFARRQALMPQVLSLSVVVNEMQDNLQRVLTKNIGLQIHCDPAAGNVKLDPTQIEQVILNLVINARDAMPKGGQLTIDVTKVTLDVEYCRLHHSVNPGDYIMMAITDSGMGMDNTTLSRVFEPFFTTKSRGNGTGLGLAMVYGIVRQSGGHIWVYSEPGQGTTFKLYFPGIDQQVDLGQNVSLHAPARGTETVMVAEDEEFYRHLLVQILEQQGYTVIAARDGLEALELMRARNTPIDLLLTDAVLPGLNGKKLAEGVRQSYPEVRILFMSGYTSDVVVQHGILDAEVEFLPKPFTPRMLLLKIRELLDMGAGKNSAA